MVLIITIIIFFAIILIAIISSISSSIEEKNKRQEREKNEIEARSIAGYALSYAKINNYEKALELIDISIQKNKKAEYFFLRGNVKILMGDKNGAFSDYSIAINLEPMVGNYYLARGAIYVYYGNTDLALKDLELANKYGSKEACEYINKLKENNRR